MKRTMITLFVAAAIASPTVAAETKARSAGAHPVVYDDYPESDLVIDVGPDIVLTITGEARLRYEWIENTSDFSDSGDEFIFDDEETNDSFSYGAMRFNLGVRVDLPRDVAAVIELQSTSEFGGGAEDYDFWSGWETRFHNSQAQQPGNVDDPGGFRDKPWAGELAYWRSSQQLTHDGFYLYQGYIETAHVGDSIFSMRFGRQELAYGTEWILGNQDWYDGLSYDSIKGIFEFTDKHRLDIFWSKIAERDTMFGPDGEHAGDDSDLFGAYFSAQSLGGSSVGMDAYVVGFRDQFDALTDVTVNAIGGGEFKVTNFSTTASLPGRGGVSTDGTTFVESYWAGLRFFRERETGFHFSVEGTYQWGSYDADISGIGVSVQDQLDIAAWGFEGFAGFTWDVPSHPTIKGGVTYASGSSASDYAQGDSNTFWAPATEIHERLGLADLVTASNVIAFNLGYAGSHERHSWGVDVYHFQQAETDPVIEGAIVSTAALASHHDLSDELGQELDLWYNYQYSEHMVAQFAVAYFNAGGFIEDVNRCWGGNCNPDAIPNSDSRETSDAWRVYANLLVRF